MARVLARQAKAVSVPSASAATVAHAHGGHGHHEIRDHVKDKIGKREVVGYGFNGQPSYVDRLDFPFPAIRYREPSAEIEMLREKEKGDWKRLTLEEKKALYRASFCQTLVELNAPTGEWKSILGFTLIGISLSLWIFMWTKKYVYPPLPPTMTPEWQEAMLQRMIDQRQNRIEGISADYDYENKKWKE
ncbi:hypothetical protein FNE60_30210 [Klebsiella pneumoniae]|nr:hypothetical protein FNE60_30210 [Klebsiella pneumoniae]